MWGLVEWSVVVSRNDILASTRAFQAPFEGSLQLETHEYQEKEA